MKYRCDCCRKVLRNKIKYCVFCRRYIKELLRNLQPKRKYSYRAKKKIGYVKYSKIEKDKMMRDDLEAYEGRKMIESVRKKQETNPDLLKVR